MTESNAQYLARVVEEIICGYYHGCTTGDCPHENQNQCFAEMIKQGAAAQLSGPLVKQMAAELRKQAPAWDSCEHDYEPNTTMDYFRCENCGARPTVVDTLVAYTAELKRLGLGE